MRDVDDDVRTVAASALLPITDTLSTSLLHDELCSVVDTLWDCLGEGGDDLGSSTGAVMNLLGELKAPLSLRRTQLTCRRYDLSFQRHERNERSRCFWVGILLLTGLSSWQS